MKRILCVDCGRSLGDTEVALNLKLRGRATGRLSCLACLAQKLDCDEEKLRSMAEYYRENGCELFARVYVDGPGRVNA